MSDGTIDISAELGPARDQGQRGTCLAFAANAAHEQARLRRRGEPRHALGEELLYWRCKQIDADGLEGTIPCSVATALVDPGQSAAKLWPYDGARDERSPGFTPPPAALEASELRHASLREVQATAEKLWELVEGGQVAIVGIRLWAQFFDDHGGDLVVLPGTEFLPGGHAVAVVGFNREAEWFLIRNSWGAGWGDSGHARLPEASLAQGVLLGAWAVEDDIDD